VSWRMKRSRWHRMEDVGYAFEKAHPQLLTISQHPDAADKESADLELELRHTSPSTQ
jgi:hypothetical protein